MREGKEDAAPNQLRIDTRRNHLDCSAWSFIGGHRRGDEPFSLSDGHQSLAQVNAALTGAKGRGRLMGRVESLQVALQFGLLSEQVMMLQPREKARWRERGEQQRRGHLRGKAGRTACNRRIGGSYWESRL